MNPLDEPLMTFTNSESMDSFREPGKSIPAATSLEKKLLMTIGVLIVIGIGLTIGIVQLKHSHNYDSVGYMEAPSSQSSDDDKNMCFAPTCITEAANLLNSMDTSVDPCTDFYSFVCGNWIKNNYLVSNLESEFLKMAKTIFLRVKDILGTLELEKNLSSNKQKTADFYRACMDSDRRNELGASELLLDLKNFGGWPLIDETWQSSNFNWSDLMVQFFKNGYINNMLFALNVYVDIKNTSTTLLKVSQPSLGLYKQELYADEEIVIDYKAILFMLAKLLRDDVDLVQGLDDIQEAFKVENSIANVLEYTNMNYPKTFYHIKTLKEIEILAPQVPWRKLLKDLLPPNTSITKYERIMVTSPSYIEALNTILEGTKPRALANYMFYRAVLSAANFLGDKFQKIANVLLDTKHVGQPAQWEMCAANTLEFFPFPLTARYVKMYTSRKTKEVLGMMVEDLKDSIKHDIVNTDWLDGDTKINAANKVEKLKAEIGYRDEIMNDGNLDRYYENVKITDNHFTNIKQLIAFRFRQNMEGLHVKRDGFKWFEEDDLLTANAYYRPTENKITIPVGVLQDTVFAADRPNYINYGSLGMIVGHELTHAFDSIGSLYDAEGNYRNWWSEVSWQNFEQKVECYEAQYDRYYVPEAEAFVNGHQTLPENIADNGGLKAAYYAYNRLLSRVNSEKSLPGLHLYNEKQMFWIAFGSVWCRKPTNESIQYAMKYDVHAPEKYRVIGSLSNMKEFSEDFNCKLYSAMDPALKCSLWN